jgi:hypothetical protein
MKTKGRARRPPKRQGGKAYKRWMDEVMNQPVSPAGFPPFVHSDDHVRSLRNIWFALDNTSSTDIHGVVGPLRLNGNQGSVPSLHEKGGSRSIAEVLHEHWTFDEGTHKRLVSSEWVPATLIGRRNRMNAKKRTRTARYPARPFMQPALTKEAPKFPALWLGMAA